MTTSVPFLDLKAMHAEVAEEVAEGFARVLRDTCFVGGPDVGAFETAFAAFSGRAHCVGMANGTDAVELALRAVGIGPGDEVIIPANTFIATAEAVVRAGAQPVLAEVDPDTLLLDPDAVEAAVGPRTAAVVPVHLYGQIAPMARIQELAQRHGLAVVEDAAQAQGALQDGRGIGSGSAVAATSFYPGKNLGAYGDGGAAVTDSAELADRMRMLGEHGSRRKYIHEILGCNSRLDTLQAVVLNAKLSRLEKWNEARRVAAANYERLLSHLDLVTPATAEGNLHVWHLYAVRVEAELRDAVLAQMTSQGVGVGIHYPVPVHLHEAFAHLGKVAGDFPVAEEACARMISLPMFPTLTATQQELVASALGAALEVSVREAS